MPELVNGQKLTEGEHRHCQIPRPGLRWFCPAIGLWYTSVVVSLALALFAKLPQRTGRLGVPWKLRRCCTSYSAADALYYSPPLIERRVVSGTATVRHIDCTKTRATRNPGTYRSRSRDITRRRAHPSQIQEAKLKWTFEKFWCSSRVEASL